jgi:Helicase associated domain
MSCDVPWRDVHDLDFLFYSVATHNFFFCFGLAFFIFPNDDDIEYCRRWTQYVKHLYHHDPDSLPSARIVRLNKMHFEWGDTLAGAAAASATYAATTTTTATTNRGWGGDRQSASFKAKKKSHKATNSHKKETAAASPPKPDRPTSSSISAKRAKHKVAAPRPDRSNSSRAAAPTTNFSQPIRVGLISFETRLRHIKRYKHLHGHTKVPWGYQGFHRLGRFVYRLKYKRFVLQNLDLDQYEALEDIDFDWSFKHLGKTYWE